MHLTMIYESLLYMLLVVTGCGCTELQEKAFRSLVNLCPAQYIPSDNNTWSTLNLTSNYASCCTDNYTASPIGNIVTNRPDFSGSGQRCLFPSIETNPTSWSMKRSYYMIDRAPDGDCVVPDVDTQSTKNDDLILTKATCNDSEVIPSRRFLPSFSPSSGFIYKNPQCAYCHGRYDITIWKQRAQCSTKMAFSECNLYFSYIGDYSDIKHLQCFTDEFSSCPTIFSVENAGLPTDVDLSRKDIFDACLMDRLPRFDYQHHSSKNVFCYICQNCVKGARCVSTDACPVQRSEENRVNRRKTFIRILDPNVSPSTSASDIGRSERDNVLCQSYDNGKVCYTVLCPLGQGKAYNGDKTVCKMDSTQWMADRFALLLSLEFHGRMNVTKSDLKAMIDNGQVKSPWKSTWRLNAVHKPLYRSVSMTNTTVHYVYNITSARAINFITQLYVEISYVHNEVKPEALMRYIRETLPKKWYLNTGLETITATQSISKFKFATITDSDSEELLVLPFWQLSPGVSSQQRFMYEPIIVSRPKHTPYYITKSFICKQVEIPMAYFNNIATFGSEVLALHYNRTSSVLFDGEFYLHRKANGEESIRICTSDAGLKSIRSCNLNVCPDISIITLLFLCTWTARQMI